MNIEHENNIESLREYAIILKKENEILHRRIAERFLETDSNVPKKKRYEFEVDGRHVDFSSGIPIITSSMDFAVWLANLFGFMKIGWYQVLPAIWESIKRN